LKCKCCPKAKSYNKATPPEIPKRQDLNEESQALVFFKPENQQMQTAIPLRTLAYYKKQLENIDFEDKV
jgi:hypothetical protein